MKKALKIIAIVLGILFLLIGGALGYFGSKGFPVYEVDTPSIDISPDSAMLARGEYIVNLNCSFCHRSTEGGNLLSGRFFEENGLGKWYAPNITKDENAGIGKYSNEELAYFLRTGIMRDGKLAAPMMPRFNHLSDEDLKSVIAYLRSDAIPVQANSTMQPASKPNLLAKVLANLAFKPIPYPAAPISTPSASDEAAYGKYLSTAMVHCYHCHSASFDTANDLEPEKSAGYLGGGNEIINHFNPEEIVLSSNLTPHQEYGLGAWTEEEFANALRYGQGKDEQAINGAMPKFAAFTDEDVHAIWAYLQTVPILDNEVKAQ